MGLPDLVPAKATSDYPSVCIPGNRAHARLSGAFTRQRKMTRRPQRAVKAGNRLFAAINCAEELALWSSPSSNR
jgi:hypothetical protein